MPEYEVEFTANVNITGWHAVDAEDEDDARKKAEVSLQSGGYKEFFDLGYDEVEYVDIYGITKVAD